MLNVKRRRRLAIANARTLPVVLGVTRAGSKENQRRLGSLSADEALAIAAYRRYTWERRSGKNAINPRYEGREGKRPERRSSHYDARIVRCIDFERCLAAIGPYFATVLKLWHVDGESLDTVAHATGRSPSTIMGDLGKASAALASELIARDLI